MSSSTRTRRHLTEAAREAAALARQRRREHRSQFPEDHQLVMLVVRAAETPLGYGWQIRRFGQMQPVAESRDCFDNPVDAGCSGQLALERMKGTAAS